MEKNWTGERLETFIYSRDAVEHIHRYAMVNTYIENKVVLDIACGEGYGSNIMSEKAKFVHGVDIDRQTIKYAKEKYKKKNLEYSIGNADAIPLLDNSVDVVVSFETIEHHDKHDEMLLEIQRVLKPEGIVIISTPDKLFYTEKAKFRNEFHVKELYKNEFLDLLSKYFSKKQLLTKKYFNGISMIQEEKKTVELNFFSGDYNRVYEKNIDPLFLVIIASNDHFNYQKTSIFDGSLIIEKQISDAIYKSNSYKVGNLVLSPLKFLKRLFK